jgi:hypothetical protein
VFTIYDFRSTSFFQIVCHTTGAAPRLVRCFSWRCLHHRHLSWVWVAPGRVYFTGATAASGRVYAIGAWAAPGLVWNQKPVLILDLSTYTTEACAAVRRVYTVEACAALRVVYTTVYRGLSCKPKLRRVWTKVACMCCSFWGVYTTGTLAAEGRVYTGEACTAPGGVSTTAQVWCRHNTRVSTPSVLETEDLTLDKSNYLWG